MNTISGKILIQETNSGLGSVLVSVLILDSDTPLNLDMIQRSYCLGTVDTAPDGSFSIEYNPEAITGQKRDGKIRLGLVVFTPDFSEKPSEEEILHTSIRIRSEPGSIEKFLVQLSIDKVRAAGLLVGDPKLPADLVSSAAVKELGNRMAIKQYVEQGMHSKVGDQLKSDQQKRKKNQRIVKRYVCEKVESRFRMPDGKLADNYVSKDQNINDVQKKVVEKNLINIHRTKVRGLLNLNAEQLSQVLDENGDIRTDLSNETIEGLIFGDEEGSQIPPFIYHDEMQAACRSHTKPYEKCKDADEGDSDGEPEPDPSEPSPATMKDFKKNLSLILDTVTENSLSPHKHIQSLPTSDQIHRYIHGLQVEPGPADAPAYFDFETLHIAFDHIWKQVFDNQWSQDLIEIISGLEKLGGDPVGLVDNDTDLVTAATIEAERLTNIYKSINGGTPEQPRVAYFGLSDFINAAVGAVNDTVNGVIDIFTGGSDSGESEGGIVRDHRTGEGADQSGRPATRVPSGGPVHPRPEGGIVRDHRTGLEILNSFIQSLKELKNSDYKFTPFGAEGGEHAKNFGVLVTYRQRWVPLGYQAGELVKTIPLAPKQVQRFKSKRFYKKSYLEKKSEASESKYNTETQDTLRDISKIVREAKFETSLSITKEAGLEIPKAGGGSMTTKFDTKYERSSQNTKDSFREAIKKSAQQLKQNTSMEVTASEEEQLEFEESGEISNPNDELAMTCLFYELQRRFRVSEKIHKVLPVVLVAQELPEPSEINEKWIMKFDWILRRILLDESFIEAIDFVTSADHLAEKTIADGLENNMVKQQQLVDSLKKQLEDFRRGDVFPQPRNALQRFLIRAYDNKYGAENWRNDPERIKEVFGEQVAEQVISRRREEEEVEQQHARESTLLEEATNAFNAAHRKYAHKMIQVQRLCIHIKENIIYYMQAIWDHEIPDERFMRLQNTPVPKISGTRRYELKKTYKPRRPITWEPPLEYTISWDNLTSEEESQTLVEIADIGNLLGYMGNYMIFPLLESNELTTYMMMPYIDANSGVKDPDDFGNYSLSDFEKYVCCLKKNMVPTDFDDIKPYIDEVYQTRLSNPRNDEEDIIVPTESLFIEILPGTHPVLENFKLEHRAVDVQKVVAEVIEQQLENLRRTGLLITKEFEDPDVDKRIVVEGDSETVVSVDDDSDE